MNKLKLTEILHSLEELHLQLLTTLNKKQQILISGEANKLLSVLAEESKLIKKIKEEDHNRITSLGEPYYKLSLSKLIETQPECSEKRVWQQVHQRLQKLFKEISIVNDSNQKLLEQSLTYTQFMMEQLVPATSQSDSGTYSTEAAVKETKSSEVRMFDAKA